MSAEIYQQPTSDTGKEGKKAVVAPTLPSCPIILVTLHDTVIFPEGGGQPTDTGLITTTDGKQWEVLQCKRHGGCAVHYVPVEGTTVESALTSFEPGATVVAELGAKDFEKRYDHVREESHISPIKSTQCECRCQCTLPNICFRPSSKLDSVSLPSPGL